MSALPSAAEKNLRESPSQTAICEGLKAFPQIDEFVRGYLGMEMSLRASQAIQNAPPHAARNTLPYPQPGSRPLLRLRFGDEWVPVNLPEGTDPDVAHPRLPYFGQINSVAMIVGDVKLVSILTKPTDLEKLAEVATPLVIVKREAIDSSARALPAEFRQLHPSVQTVFLEGPPSLREVRVLSRHKGLRHILLSGISPVDLESLAALPRLESLTLIGCILARGVMFLAGIERLQRLRLVRCPKLESLKGAKGHPNLRHLSVEACRIMRAHQINELPVLASVLLEGCEKLDKLPDISPDNPVGELVIRDCNHLTDTHFLARARRLRHLELSKMPGTYLAPALGLGDLVSLRLPCMEIENSTLEGIAGLTNLRHLNLALNCGISDLEPLSRLRYLQRLSLDSCQLVRSLKPVGNLGHLSDLSIAFCHGLESLLPLKWNRSIRNLQLACLPLHLQRVEDLPHASLENLGLRAWFALKSLDFLRNLKELKFLDARDCVQVGDIGYLREHRGHLLLFCDPGSVVADSLDGSIPNIVRGPLKMHKATGEWFDLPRTDGWDHLAWRPSQLTPRMQNCLEGILKEHIQPSIREMQYLQAWAQSVDGKEGETPSSECPATGHAVGGTGTLQKTSEQPGANHPSPAPTHAGTGPRAQSAGEVASQNTAPAPQTYPPAGPATTVPIEDESDEVIDWETFKATLPLGFIRDVPSPAGPLPPRPEAVLSPVPSSRPKTVVVDTFPGKIKKGEATPQEATIRSAKTRPVTNSKKARTAVANRGAKALAPKDKARPGKPPKTSQRAKSGRDKAQVASGGAVRGKPTATAKKSPARPKAAPPGKTKAKRPAAKPSRGGGK